MSEEKIYVGEKKVKEVLPTDLTTPADGPIVNVIYDNNEGEELMTEVRYGAIKTFKRTDATKARDRLIKAAGKKMYALLMEYGPYLYEVDHILNEVVRLANDATEQATGVLWGKDHPSKRSLLDVNNILLKHYGEHKATEPESEEGASDDEPTPERGAADNADSDKG